MKPKSLILKRARSAVCQLRLACATASAALLVVCASNEARAQSFGRYICPAAPAFTEVKWRFNARNQVGGIINSSVPPSDVARDINAPVRYSHSMSVARDFMANNHVANVTFRTADAPAGSGQLSFSTEEVDDYLFWAPWSMSPKTITGNINSAAWWSVTAANSNGLLAYSPQVYPIRMGFVTDANDNRTGFTIDRVRLSCKLSGGLLPSPVFDLAPSYESSGVLMGSGDTVFTQFVPRAATHWHNVVLWAPPEDTGFTNFDMYLRCNALPTPSQYDVLRSYNASLGSSNEFYQWRTDQWCTGGTVFVAIHSRTSFGGAGQFSIMHSEQRKKDYRVKVGINTPQYASWDASAQAAALTERINRLKQAVRLFYGATEGTRFVNEFEVWNQTGGAEGTCGTYPESRCGGQHCEVCFTGHTSGAVIAPGQPYQQLRIGDGETANYIVLAHEFGHYFLRQGSPSALLRDEYNWYYYDGGPYFVNGVGPQFQAPFAYTLPVCGHSLMNQPAGNTFNLCLPSNHWRGETMGIGTPPRIHQNGIPAQGWPSNWADMIAAGDVYDKPQVDSAANNDFVSHPFDGRIDIIVH